MIFLAVQSKAKMHCAERQLVSADTHEILHNRSKAVFVCKHPIAPIPAVTSCWPLTKNDLAEDLHKRQLAALTARAYLDTDNLGTLKS